MDRGTVNKDLLSFTANTKRKKKKHIVRLIKFNMASSFYSRHGYNKNSGKQNSFIDLSLHT